MICRSGVRSIAAAEAATAAGIAPAYNVVEGFEGAGRLAAQLAAVAASMTESDPSATWRPDTLAVRGGLHRSGFDETAEALFLTSGYVYGSAAEAEAAFAGDIDRYVYSRYGNPTVATFEERLRLIEGAPACFATATGMAAVFTALAALLGSGDRVVAARSLFGSCFVILDEILPRWGVRSVFVDGSDLEQWRVALSEPTTAVFFESPSNPMQELVDVPAVCDLAHRAGAQVVVDNVFATPVLQRPIELGADIVVYSATKHIDGQGRTLGGAILGPEQFIREPVQNLMRHTGPSMSPFNAWILTKGLETLSMRVDKASASALRVAGWLEQHPRIASVRYPFLDSHPQQALAQAADVRRWHRRDPGAGRRQGRGVPAARRAPHDRHLQQPR